MSEITTIYIISAIQIILAGGLINVWVLRFHKKTKYRGKGAGDMRAEFRAYGLPLWSMYLVGALKLGIAAVLLAGLWYPMLVPNALYILLTLMLGALAMHVKVRDPLVRSVPALGIIALCLVALALI